MTGLPCLKFPFTALASCGHVISDRALAVLETPECPVCGRAYQKDKSIQINGNQEQVDALRKRLHREDMQSKDGQKPSRMDKKKRTLEKTET